MSEVLKKYGITGIKQKDLRRVRAAGLTPFVFIPKDHATMVQDEVESNFFAKFDELCDALGITEKYDEVDAEDVPQFRNDLFALVFGTGSKEAAPAEKNCVTSAPAPQT